MTTIIGFENYAVDEFGQIWGYPNKTRKGIRLIKAVVNNSGYKYIDLCKNGKIRRFLVHRLVALNLKPNLENKEQVNHINGIKTDNRICNLEWVTRSENQLHSIKYGLRTTNGEKNSQCKLNESIVKEIRKNENLSYIELSKYYKISLSTIYDIKKYRSWKHI